MKVLRTLAALICLLGVLYIVAAIPMFLIRKQPPRPVASERPSSAGGAAASTNVHRRFLLSGVALAASGLLSVVASVGLFRRREWARKSWLYIAALVLLIHAMWFLIDFFSGGLTFKAWTILAAIALMYFAPAIYLNKPTIKAQFVASDAKES